MKRRMMHRAAAVVLAAIMTFTHVPLQDIPSFEDGGVLAEEVFDSQNEDIYIASEDVAGIYLTENEGAADLQEELSDGDTEDAREDEAEDAGDLSDEELSNGMDEAVSNEEASEGMDEAVSNEEASEGMDEAESGEEASEGMDEAESGEEASEGMDEAESGEEASEGMDEAESGEEASDGTDEAESGEEASDGIDEDESGEETSGGTNEDVSGEGISDSSDEGRFDGGESGASDAESADGVDESSSAGASSGEELYEEASDEDASGRETLEGAETASGSGNPASAELSDYAKASEDNNDGDNDSDQNSEDGSSSMEDTTATAEVDDGGADDSTSDDVIKDTDSDDGKEDEITNVAASAGEDQAGNAATSDDVDDAGNAANSDDEDEAGNAANSDDEDEEGNAVISDAADEEAGMADGTASKGGEKTGEGNQDLADNEEGIGADGQDSASEGDGSGTAAGEEDFGDALVLSSEMVKEVMGAMDASNPALSEEEILLMEEGDEEEAGLMEDPGCSYFLDKESNTFYMSLLRDYEEDIVVFDELPEEGVERLKFVLDLNGYTLRPQGKKNHTGITVFGELTIRDDSAEGTGKVDGSELSNVRGIEVAERGVLRLESGTICNFHSRGNGAGISVNKGGKLYMAGGSVTGNVSEENGGGIFAYAAHDVVFEGGEDVMNLVAGNSAKNGGGLAFATTGEKPQDEDDADGTGDTGEEDNAWELDCVTLYGNRAGVNGGGLYFDEEIDVEFGADTLFSGNSAGQNGGVAYFRLASSLLAEKTRIAGNTAEQGSGGAIHMAAKASSIVMNDSVIGVAVTEEEDAKDGNAGEDPHEGMDPLTDTVEYGADKDAVLPDPWDRAALLSEAENAARRGNLSENSYGGAIYLNEKSHLELNRCDLSRNMAYTNGGGFYLAGSNNNFSDFKATKCRFERNVLDGYVSGNRLGATGYIGQYSTVNVTDSLFRKNRGASHGSGLYVNSNNGGVNIIRTDFVKNHYEAAYAPNGGSGAGLYFEDSSRGEMLLKDCQFLYNRADTDNCGSGGIRAGSTKKQVIRCTFRGNRTQGGSGGASFGGETEIVDCLFENNEAWRFAVGYNCSGGGMSSSGSKLTIKGNTVFQNNYCNYQGGGFRSSNSEVHLEAGVRILNNQSGQSGGGFLSDDNTYTYIHDGVEVSGNTAGGNGGGFYTGHLIMDGGLVGNNYCSSEGGGIFVGKEVHISGGEVSNNNGNIGGGLKFNMGSSGEITGGRIVNNLARSNGGGIWCFSGTKNKLLRIEGEAEISGNTANGSGGGLFIEKNPHCVIDGNARITGNTAKGDGGGIYSSSQGGDVTSEASNPPLVYPWALHIKGAQVYENHSNGNGNDFYSVIYFSWAWSKTDFLRKKYRVERADGGLWYDEVLKNVVEEGFDNLEENAYYEDPDNPEGDQQLIAQKKDGKTVRHYYTFLRDIDKRAKVLETGAEYATVQSAVDAAENGQTVVLIANSIENVIIRKRDGEDEGRKLTLDLAGFALRALKSGSVITVAEDMDFTLKDSSEGQSGTVADGTGSKSDYYYKFTNNYATYTYGGGVYVRSGAKFTLESGTITNNNATYGGGVFLQDEAEMLMTGGSVSANKSQGVYVYHGDNIAGDPVKDTRDYCENAPNSQDGWRHMLGAAFTMQGGEIRGNSGWGVVSQGASTLVTIEGNVRITGNIGGISANRGNGGTAYRNRDGEFEAQKNLVIRGGEISENKSSTNGVGLYLGSVVAELSDCSIINNTSNNHSGYAGGGMYIDGNNARVTLLQNVLITGNVSGYGGGIAVNGKDAVLDIRGAAIYGNTIVSGYKMRGSDIYLYKTARKVSLLDAFEMSIPEGVEKYNCWLNEVTGEKYASVSGLDLEETTRDEGLCLIAERDPAMQHSARIGDLNDEENPPVYYPTLQAAVNAALKSEKPETIYLVRDLKESIQVTGNQDLTIDLNGYNLTCERDQAIYVSKLAGNRVLSEGGDPEFVLGTLTLRSTVTEPDAGPKKPDTGDEPDAAENEDEEEVNSGCILGAGSDPGSESMRAVTINGGAVVLDEGLTIKDFYSASAGGAIYVYPVNTMGYNGELTMKAGSRITDCYSNSSGGAIYASLDNSMLAGSRVRILGGEIDHCYSRGSGGAVHVNFNRTPASYKTARDADGNYNLAELTDSDVNLLEITGGSVLQDNHCYNYGGAVYAEALNSKENTMSRHYDEIILNDMQIHDNWTETYNGGGVAIYYGFPVIGKQDVPKERTVISGNKAAQSVGGLVLDGNNNAGRYSKDRVSLTNVTISGNEAKRSYGGLYINCPAEITGCLIENNKAGMVDGSAGGVYLYTGSSLDEDRRTVMRDTVIRGNSARYAGGMRLGYLANGSLFENVEVSGNKSIEWGGGIGFESHMEGYLKGTLISFKNCRILNNYCGDGGVGMYMSWWNADVEVRDCEIAGNKSSKQSNTGGIYAAYSNKPKYELQSDGSLLNQYGTLILSGATDIHDNPGRGVNCSNILIMKDETKIRNNVCADKGAGIYKTGAWAELLGGSIEGNESVGTAVGGGLYLNYDSNAANVQAVRIKNVVDGTRIIGNKAYNGGGIFIGNHANLLMKSGHIRDNEASNFGGGVYLDSGACQQSYVTAENPGTLFDMQGGQLYDNNAAYGKDAYGVYNSTYRNSELRLVRASDMFLDAQADSVQRRGIAWIEERTDRTYEDEIKGILVYTLPLTLNFQTVKPAAAVKKADSEEYIIYNSVQEAISAILEGTHGSFGNGEKPEIVLVDDVSENVKIPGAADVVLNLNGYTLRGNGSSAIHCYGIVRVIDEKKAGNGSIGGSSMSFEGRADSTGTITGTSGQAGGGIFVESGGSVTLSSGQIKDCRAGAQVNSYTYGGSAVCVDSGTFTLEGEGAIRGNTVHYYGAAVLVRNTSGSFVMNGGVIEENKSTAGNGIICNNGGKVIITGGKIRNNYTGSVGTIMNTGSGSLNIGGSAESPVEITGNTVVNKGGAIYLDNGTAYLSNVLMQGNTVTCARQNSASGINGTGGAIYVAGGKLYINEGTEILKNKASRGGGLYQNGGTIYMMGGLISDNTAELGGGIAEYPLANMTLIISKGKVAGNHTTLYGSGNDIYSWYEGKDGKFDNPALVKEKPNLTVIPAAQMGDEAYNAWKDDNYKGSKRTALNIASPLDPDSGGQFVTGSVPDSSNLQLTAAYYDTEVETQFDTDVYIQNFRLEPKPGEQGTGIVDGTVKKENAEFIASEVKARDKDGAVLVSEGEHAGMYLYNGEYYEPDQLVEWTAGYDGKNENLLVRSFDTITYSFLLTINAQKGAESGVSRVVRPWVEIMLPCDTTEAEFNTDSVKETFKNAPSFSIRQENGRTVQVMSGYWEQEMQDAEQVNKSFSISVYAMKNGDTLKPHFRAWIEGNEANVTKVQPVNVPGTQNNPEGAQQGADPTTAVLSEEQEGEASGTDGQGSRETEEEALLQGDETDPPAQNGETNPPAQNGSEGGNQNQGGTDDTDPQNEVAPVLEFDSPTITISAAPKYNAAIDYNSHLAYDSYFDLENGVEATAEDYRKAKAEGNGNIIHGMMVGYGLMVSLYNEIDDYTDGLKGIELPDKSLEFDVSFKGSLFYNGDPLFPEGTDAARKVEGKPIIWAYKENVNTEWGKPLNEVSLYSRTMDWNDEDDIDKDTRYAYDAAPFNSGGDERSCYSGGTWLMTDARSGQSGSGDGQSGSGDGQDSKETTIHVKVSNYDLNGNTLPNRTSDNVEDERFKTKQVKPFTAGYVQLIFPYDEDVIKEAYREYYGEYIGGYVSVAMHAAVSKMDARGRSGRQAISVTDVKTAGLDMLNTYYEKEDPKSLLEGTEEDPAIASCEMRYGDNYCFNDFARYISEGEDGNGDSISKTTYFENASIGTLTGSEGKGSTPIGSVVYMGGTLTYNSARIMTDDITRPKYYIDSKDYNTNTDNRLEYNYMTAMNFLQKFDAEVFHPAYMDAYIDKEFNPYSTNGTNISQTNTISNGYTKMNKQGTKVNAFQIRTSETRADWDTVQNNKPLNYRLTILYGAKPDKADGTPGGNWEKKTWITEDGVEQDDGGAEDMDRYHEENLIYYKTLQELEEAGKTCVAILFEFRNTTIRTNRNISVHTWLQVTDDFTKTGNTYIATNDARAWGTYRRFYKENWRKPGTWQSNIQPILYNYSYSQEPDRVPYPIIDDLESGQAKRQKNGMEDLAERSAWTRKIYRKSDSDNPESETEYVNDQTFTGYTYFIQDCHSIVKGNPEDDYKNKYKKTQYKNGVREAGGHNGWDRGNVLLLYTLDTSIKIGNRDYPVGSTNPKTAYNVDKGDRIVNYVVDPSVAYSSAATANELVRNGSQAARVTIELEIPKGLTYRKGSINYDYSGSGYTADQLQWDVEVAEETDENGMRKVTLTTYVNDIDKTLPDFTFSCNIGDKKNSENDVKAGQTLNVVARIYAEYQETNRLAAEAHMDNSAITIMKETMSGASKDVEETLVEVGEDIVFTLQYVNGGLEASDIRFADVLPYRADGRGSSFTGAYRVKEIDVSFSDKASYYHFIGKPVPEGEDGDPDEEENQNSGNNGNGNGNGGNGNGNGNDGNGNGNGNGNNGNGSGNGNNGNGSGNGGNGNGNGNGNNGNGNGNGGNGNGNGNGNNGNGNGNDGNGNGNGNDGNGNGNGNGNNGNGGDNEGGADENEYVFSPDMIQGSIRFESGQKQPASEAAQMSLIERMPSATKLEGHSDVEIVPADEDNLALSEDGSPVYTIKYLINSDSLIYEKASIPNTENARGVAIYGYFPQLSGLRVQPGVLQDVTMRVVMSAVSTGNTFLEDTAEVKINNRAGSKVQTGENKYINNFISSLGGIDDEVTNVLPSTNVTVTTVGRTISGYVWLDKDHDNVYASKESRDSLMKNVNVNLYKLNEDGKTYSLAKDILGNELSTFRTGDDGKYAFQNLAPGWYKVQISNPSNDYVSMKDNSLKTKQPLPFDQLALTDIFDEGYSVKSGEDKSKSDQDFIENRYRVERDNSNYGIYTAKRGTEESPEYEFSPADWAVLAEKLKNEKLYTYPDNELPDMGSMLFARTRPIRMPEKTDIGGGVFTSNNWNFGLYYMYPSLEKKWENMVFEPSVGTELALTLRGYIDLSEQGDIGTDAYPYYKEEVSAGAAEGASMDGTSTDGTSADGKNPDGSDKSDGVIRAFSPLEKAFSRAREEDYESVYENIITMKAELNNKNQRVCNVTVTKSGINLWSSGTFTETPHEKEDKSAPYYTWTMEPDYGQSYAVLPIPALVYRDNREYEVKYTLSEAMLRGTTDKESTYREEVFDPRFDVTEDSGTGEIHVNREILILEAVNTRPLSGFDFVKVDSVTKKPIIEIIERDPETGKRTNKDLQDVTFRLYRSRTDADVIDPTFPGADSDDPVLLDKLSDKDLVRMVKLEDGSYRPRRFGDPTATTEDVEISGEMTITQDTGKLAVSELPAGAYWLMESKAQDGYALPGGYWKILIYASPDKADGNANADENAGDEGGASGEADPSEGSEGGNGDKLDTLIIRGSVKSQTEALELVEGSLRETKVVVEGSDEKSKINQMTYDGTSFKLPNKPGLLMARTGGSGTKAYLFFGLLAVMAGAAGWWLERKKRRAAA